MYIVAGGRHSGKTTMLLDLCIANHGIFVVNNNRELMLVKQMVDESDKYSPEQKKNFKIVTRDQLKDDNFTRGRLEFQPCSQPYLYMDNIPEFDLYDWIYRKKVLACSINADEPFYEIVDLEDKISVKKLRKANPCLMPKKPSFFKRFKRWINGL